MSQDVIARRTGPSTWSVINRRSGAVLAAGVGAAQLVNTIHDAIVQGQVAAAQAEQIVQYAQQTAVQIRQDAEAVAARVNDIRNYFKPGSRKRLRTPQRKRKAGGTGFQVHLIYSIRKPNKENYGA